MLDLASRLDKRKFTPCVISTAESDAMEDDFARRGIPVRRLPYRGISLRPGKASALLRQARLFFHEFARVLEDRNVSVLHAYLPAGNVLGMAAALLCRTRVRIVSKRALCRYKEGHAVYSFFEDLANFAAHAVMVNSRAVAQDVRRTERFAAGKMFLIYNGLDIARDFPDDGSRMPPDIGVASGDPAITYVANLREDKAHRCLVEAARTVVAAFPSARFLFVGREDREAASVRAKIRELRLERNIVLTGPRKDVPAILKSSCLVAHPGEQEGLSNAILEAMAAGIPVVASRAGGNPEAVSDGATGLLVPPGNPDALASAILQLLRDPAKARTMGRAGSERARQRFSMDHMVTAAEKTYLELLEGKPLACRV